MAEIFFTDGTKKVVEPENGKDFKLAELNKIVGGYIECINLPKQLMFVIDEEGKLKDKPINERATLMYQAYVGQDVIVGDVLFCKQSQVK